MNDQARLRLFMTVDAVGGVWTYALDLATGLAAHGMETTLAVIGPAPDATQQRDAARVPGLELRHFDLPLEWMAGSAAEVDAVGEVLARTATSIGADIIHLNAPGPAAEVQFPAPLVIACHSCVATWWQAVRGGPMPEEFRWRTDLVAKAYRRADLLVAPSMSFAEATRAVYGLPEPPRVIPNGRRAALRHQTGSEEVFAFTAGRLWDEGKGAVTLDRAAMELPLPLLAAGPVQGPNGVRVDLPYLVLLGPLTAREIAARLSARPIFVSAARYEPFGLSVLEAAQAGCALVLADTVGFRELWGEAAEFVPVGDASSFARAIRRLAADPGRRSALGAAAEARSRCYGLGRQVDAMLGAYRGLLHGVTGRNAAA